MITADVRITHQHTGRNGVQLSEQLKTFAAAPDTDAVAKRRDRKKMKSNVARDGIGVA